MNLMQTSKRSLANLGETFLERTAGVIGHGKKLLALCEARKFVSKWLPGSCHHSAACHYHLCA